LEIDAFGIILSFVLILLGAISRQWWFVYLTGLVFLAFYPRIETLWILLGEIVVAWIWKNVSGELRSQSFLVIVILVSTGVIALVFEQAFAGVLIAISLALLLFLTSGIFAAKRVHGRVKIELRDMSEGLKKAKGTPPDLYAETAGLSTGGGSILGEAITDNPNQRLVSTGLVDRISQGSKNLLDGLKRIFKL